MSVPCYDMPLLQYVVTWYDLDFHAPYLNTGEQIQISSHETLKCTVATMIKEESKKYFFFQTWNVSFCYRRFPELSV